MHKFTLVERLRYRFDTMMSRSPLFSILWLFLAALAFVILLACVAYVFRIVPPHADDGTVLTWQEVVWFSLLQTLNANLLTGDFRSSLYMGAVAMATVVGLLLIGSLIGILTNGLQNRLAQLRKGRSFVVERDHMVILGWSENIYTLVSELARANEHRRMCIAILADRDKVDMEDALREHVGKTGRTRLVCRTGEPIDLHDLELVNPLAARTVMILPPDEENPDAHVIKTILALTNHPDHRADHFKIVAQLHDPENETAARTVGGAQVHLVIGHDLIAHLIVQTLRQSGLAQLYTTLLDFDGDEIYFVQEPQLVGKTFGNALMAYEDSALIGVYTADGQVLLNPPMQTVLAAGDRVIAISADDDTVVMNGRPPQMLDTHTMPLPSRAKPQAKRILFLGWNHWVSHVIRELDAFMAAGSELTVVASDAALGPLLADLGAELAHQRVSFVCDNPVQRTVLAQLNIPSYQHVVTVSDMTEESPAHADAHTLITLLYLREIGAQCNHSFSIVSELLDERTRRLAEVTRADDFIISNRLLSLMLTQLAENPEIAEVYRLLFDPSGAEFYFKPMADYVAVGEMLDFYTVVDAARRYGECAVGYRIQNDAADPTRAYGIHVNPPKSHTRCFAENDRVIVLANG